MEIAGQTRETVNGIVREREREEREVEQKSAKKEVSKLVESEEIN